MGPLHRRDFLRVLLGVGAAPFLVREVAAARPGIVDYLEKSPLVYISPLLANGKESTCHGEVWFSWQGGSAMIITAKGGWKARSLARGQDRARLWVGDFGRWKQLIGRNEEFRKAPSIDAKGRVVKDSAVFARLLADYEKKYPAEIGEWRDRFKKGFASGESVLIAYEPIPG